MGIQSRLNTYIYILVIKNIYKIMALLRMRSSTLNHGQEPKKYQKIASMATNFDISNEKLQKLDSEVNTTVDSTFDLKLGKQANRGHKGLYSKMNSLRTSRTLEIFKISDQIESQSSNKQVRVENNLTQLQDSNLKQRMTELFDLYLQEQILKHYCGLTGWKFQSQAKLMENLVLPTLSLLSIRKANIKAMFQPFLASLSQRYLLKTSRDVFSRLSTPALLIEITQVWIRIKQAQIKLKRELRSSFAQFKRSFCNQEDGLTRIEKRKLFGFLFEGSKESAMVNLIQVFIFCYKIGGEDESRGLEDWLQQY